MSLIGLGAMGLPMARNLAAAGPLTVWNRSPRSSAEVGGARVAQTLPDAVADVVVTVLPDIADVRDVLFGTGSGEGLLAGLGRRARRPIVLVCGTVSPVALRGLAAEMDERGVTIADAPLSGGVLGAAEGRLSIMVGASEPDFAVIGRVLAPCAKSVVRMGDVGAGATAKLCNQLVVAESVAALSEAFALARAAGIDPETLADALGAGLAESEVLRQKRHHWVEESFEPGGTVAYQVKDLRYALEVAAAHGLELDGARTALSLFERSVAAGDGGLDHTGVYRVIAR
ncbi:NAD(P)-dependent oxidoreductase [Microbacterium sp. Root53]|uniref:NAD(P)-dependent oxidoreductase n=1 Tax=Microbacterium sp. Root53 TaxID=1736553 RepID=UPI00138EF875|nr:NAD(P)-dependent oxidoreductase [Microbacterium sp. Root53]